MISACGFIAARWAHASAANPRVSAALPQVWGASRTLFDWYADDVIEGRPFATHRRLVPLPDAARLGVTFDPKAMARCHARYLKKPIPLGQNRGVWGMFSQDLSASGLNPEALRQC